MISINKNDINKDIENIENNENNENNGDLQKNNSHLLTNIMICGFIMIGSVLFFTLLFAIFVSFSYIFQK
jgi:hypothetical protein